MLLHRRLMSLIGVVSLLGGSARSANAQPNAITNQTESLNSIQAEMLGQDSVLSRPFTALFEIRVERNLLGPDKGKHIKACHYSASPSALGLSVETRYEGDPPYRTVDAPGYRELDFDVDGNLIVWRSLRKVSLCTAEFNRTYDEQETLIIASTGQILSRSRGGTVYEYPVDSRANFYEFDQFRMAAGRGFAGKVERPKAQSPLAGGIRELVVDAPFGPELSENWFLYVDAQNASLVRQADRFIPTVVGASFHMENSGMLAKDGLTLATDGSLSYAISEQQDFILQVAVSDFATHEDEKHLTRMRALLTGSFPDGVQILDHRALFSRRGTGGDTEPEE